MKKKNSKSKAPNDVAQIRAVLKANTAALKAKDAKAVIAVSGAGYTGYNLAPPLKAGGGGGIQKAIDGLNAWFATWDGPVNSEIVNPKISVGGDIAYVHGLAHMTGKRTDGEETDLWFRMTLGLKKSKRGWKIVHEHQSVPFYMDGSFRAAVDLKP
ncbi:MAG TPA: nuclear transport factor 2 family protein, partial [Rhizomicrobium sp.]|nr:nuclear transport factor 2 family protein [Rhizomicrobium sp.]